MKIDDRKHCTGCGACADICPSKGCSLILVNTGKGRDLLHSVKDRLVLEERTYEEARQGNGQLRNPAPRQPARDFFCKMDWAKIAPKINYGKPSPLRRLQRSCKTDSSKPVGSRQTRSHRP